MQVDPATWRALVVDDVPGVRSALTRELSNSGLEVFCAGGEEDAMGILADHWIDVVVVEHRPPEFCGIDLLERIRRVHPHTHRVIITGQPTFSVMREAINRAGVSFILTKPWDSHALRDALRNLVGVRRTLTVPLNIDPRNPSPASGLDGGRAAASSQRILALLNACRTEEQIHAVLLREFVRLTAADRFWWVDARDHTFSLFDSDGQTLQVQSVDTLDAATFEFVDRSRRGDRPDLFEVDDEGIEGAILAVPVRCLGRDIGVFGVRARRSTLVSGIPLEVAESIVEGVGFALERARRDLAREDSMEIEDTGRPGRQNAVDVETLVNQTIDKMRRLSRSETSVLVASDVGVSKLRIDRARLEGVLWQLLRNAREIAGDRGVVRVRSRCRRREGRRGVEISVNGEAPRAIDELGASCEKRDASETRRRARAQARDGIDSEVRGSCAAFWLPVERR